MVYHIKKQSFLEFWGLAIMGVLLWEFESTIVKVRHILLLESNERFQPNRTQTLNWAFESLNLPTYQKPTETTAKPPHPTICMSQKVRIKN